MTSAQAHADEVGIKAACEALGVARATLYRRRAADAPNAAEPQQRRTQKRALNEQERVAVLDELSSPRFVDASPAAAYATMLDEGRYLCSISTMYRILRAADSVRERRDQLSHPAYSKPELLATAPNQLWSWDITKLRGPAKWTYYYLYVILDVFSRYVVGWMVASRECATLAVRLVRETCEAQGIEEGQLTVHADRGSSMKSKLLAQLFADLGVTKTHSRPHVSNDNPFSESQFKTMKYRPDFPDRFGSQEDARAFCQPFFTWYNHEHRHSGLALMTPQAVHYGHAAELTEARRLVLEAAAAAHPERFVRGRPRPPALPTEVWINPPIVTPGGDEKTGRAQGPDPVRVATCPGARVALQQSPVFRAGAEHPTRSVAGAPTPFGGPEAKNSGGLGAEPPSEFNAATKSRPRETVIV